MEIQAVIFCVLLGCLISFLVIPLACLRDLLRSVAFLRAEDLNRNVDPVIPRSLGGIALMTSFICVVVFIACSYPSVLIGPPYLQTTILWGALSVFCVGLWDDYRPMGRPWRILSQVLVALIAYANGLRIDLPWAYSSDPGHHSIVWSMPLTILWLVGLTNMTGFAARFENRPGGKAIEMFALFAVLVLVGASSGAAFTTLYALGAAGGLVGCILCGLSSVPAQLGGAGAGFVGFLVASIATVPREDGSTVSAATSLVALGVAGFWSLVLLRKEQKGFAPLLRYEKAAVPPAIRPSVPSERSRW